MIGNRKAVRSKAASQERDRGKKVTFSVDLIVKVW
jgi:hypothetical protein